MDRLAPLTTSALFAASALVCVSCAPSRHVHPSGQVSSPTEHRATPPPACATRSPGNCDASVMSGCASDAECTAGLDGRCTLATDATCSCSYAECSTDDDCPAGTDCFCNVYRADDAGASGGPSRCIDSSCRTDADCSPGGFCSPSLNETAATDCYATTGWYCHTPKDECGIDADCVSDSAGGPYAGACVYSPSAGHWVCADFGRCG